MFKGAKEVTKESITDALALVQYLEKDLGGKIGQTYSVFAFCQFLCGKGF